MLTSTNYRKIFTTWLSFAFASLVLIGLEQLNLTAPIWSVTELLTIPVKQNIWHQQQSIQQRFSWWQYWKQGQEELIRTKRALQQRAINATQIGELKTENQNLRKLLGVPLASNWKFLPSFVVGKNNHQIIINKGQKHGVKQGMMVISISDKSTNMGILVGRIKRVNPRQSWVDTLTSEEIRVPVDIRDQINGKQTGEAILSWSANTLKAQKILPEEIIKIGDIVVTQGQAFQPQSNSGWLAGIPIGVITQINFERETDIYQQALVNWLTDIKQLDQVYVITEW